MAYKSDSSFEKSVSLLPDKSVVIEVGAYRGDSVMYLLRERPQAKVYAIEPCEDSYKILLERHSNSFNLAILDKSGKCRVLRRDGIKRFVVKDDPEGKTLKMTMDKFMSINDIAHANLIRFDCAGAEYKIFHTRCEFLKKTDMICITFQKHRRLIKDINIREEQNYVTKCLQTSGFKLILSEGLELTEDRYQLWVKEFIAKKS